MIPAARKPKKSDWLKTRNLKYHVRNTSSSGQQQAMWMFVVIVVAMMAAFSQIRSTTQVIEKPTRMVTSVITNAQESKPVETKSNSR